VYQVGACYCITVLQLLITVEQNLTRPCSRLEDVSWADPLSSSKLDEVTGYIHVPVALVPRREPHVLWNRGLGYPILGLGAVEPWMPRSTARSQITVLPRLSRLHTTLTVRRLKQGYKAKRIPDPSFLKLPKTKRA
jgi:hypothetical protein